MRVKEVRMRTGRVSCMFVSRRLRRFAVGGIVLVTDRRGCCIRIAIKY